jgi:hypothetical protein
MKKVSKKIVPTLGIATDAIVRTSGPLTSLGCAACSSVTPTVINPSRESMGSAADGSW